MGAVNQSHFQRTHRTPFPGTKRPKNEAHQSPKSNAEVKQQGYTYPLPPLIPSWREQGLSSSVLVVRLYKAHRIMSIHSSITRLIERDGCHDPWTCFTHQIDRDSLSSGPFPATSIHNAVRCHSILLRVKVRR